MLKISLVKVNVNDAQVETVGHEVGQLVEVQLCVLVTGTQLESVQL